MGGLVFPRSEGHSTCGFEETYHLPGGNGVGAVHRTFGFVFGGSDCSNAGRGLTGN